MSQSAEPILTRGVPNTGGKCQCINGFPERLGSAARGNNDGIVTLILPDMKFTCNGTIVEFTVAGRQQRGAAQDPKIQVWRENITQSGAYYKPNPDIPVNTSVCDGGLQQLSTNNWLFHCKLGSRAPQVSVQAGDILGIELPPTKEDEFVPWFTRPIYRGSRAITYLFEGQLPTTVELSNRTYINKVHEQPQIAITLSGL